MFHYLFVTSLPCSRLRFLHLLFVTSENYLLKVSNVSLSVCDVIALFLASAASSSVGYKFTTLYYLLKRFPLFHYLFLTPLLCSQLELSPLLFVTSLYYLFMDSVVSLPACYVTALFSDSIVPSAVCCVTIL